MVVASDWSEERVRRLLVQAESQAQNAVLLGARLGLILRNLDRGFYPGVLGDPSLKKLLARFPDVGLIETEPGSADFRFVFRSAGAGTSASTPPESMAASAQEQNIWLAKELWLGMTQRLSRERRYFDLQTRSVVQAPLDEDGQPGSPVQEEPERYLVVPVLSEEDIRTAALAFIGKVAREDVRQELSEALGQEGSGPRFQSALRQAGLLPAWLTAFRLYVAGRAREWLEYHHIPVGAFVRTRPKPSATPIRAEGAVSPQQSQPARVLGISRRVLRPLVLQAISRMSDEELLGLNIPLRYLVTGEEA